jgi:hypothetical protein
MEETTMERIPHINDGSLTSLGRLGSGAETGEKNGRSTSRATPRRHGSVSSGRENDAGQPYRMSYLRSQGMPEKQMS